MKVVAFSDTHGLHKQVKLPKSHVLVFAGDAMTCGYREHELINFLDWFNSQEAEYKIMIAGNHDRYIENYSRLFKDLLRYHPSITYLENSGVEINGVKFWGTPDSKKFCGWAFNKTEKQLENIFSNIPTDVDVLISHAPQYSVLDQLENGQSVGEKTLSKRIKQLENLQYHIFGHIHCGYGKNINGHTSLNVSVVNEEYQIQNKPVLFMLPKEQNDERSVATEADQGT